MWENKSVLETTFMTFVIFKNMKALQRCQKKNQENSQFYSLTCLGRVDSDHWTEGTLSFTVVSANLDMEWGERRDAVVSVHVARRAGGRGGHVCPANLPKGTESYDVTEAFAIL